MKKANDLIYSQTDKMKLLKSEKLYADVIATRFQQIDEKKKVKEIEKERDSEFHEHIIKEVARLEQIEKGKLEKTKNLNHEIKISRFQQLEEARRMKFEHDEALRLAGLEMKEKAVASLVAEQAELEEKKKQAAAANIRMLKANADLKTIRQQIIERERREEAERDAQVEGIEARKIALKRLEKERFDRSQIARQRMIDAATEQLANKANQDNALLERQVQEMKEKEDRIFAEKEAERTRQYELAVASRNAQIAARKEAKEKQLAEENRLLEKWRLENEAAMQREKDKVARARAETIALKNQQKIEGELRRRAKEEERKREIEETRFLQSIDVSDEGRFVELCQAEIEKNIREGKPVYTLLKALEYSQPPLLAAKTVPIDREKLKHRNEN